MASLDTCRATNSTNTHFKNTKSQEARLTSGMTGEALKAFNALNNYGGIVAATDGSGDGDSPKAFITVLLFDGIFNFVDVAHQQISTAAEQGSTDPKAPFELLSRDVTITEPGYAYIYISNENPTKADVYFDDFSIAHTPGNVIQYNEYYPFGALNQNSWTREGAKDNAFLYNGGSELNALTGLSDTDLRGYDPMLGRFHQIDILSVMTPDISPYAYVGNDPVAKNDPTGAYQDTMVREGDWWDYQPRMDGTGGGAGPSMFGSTGIHHDGYNYGPEFSDILTAADYEITLADGTVLAQNSDGTWGYWTQYATATGIGTFFTPLTQQGQTKGACPTCPGSNYISGLSPGFTIDPHSKSFTDISDPKNYPGIKIYQTSLVVKGTGVTIPGIGILISSTIKPGLAMTQMLQHEYGHFLDYTFSPDISINRVGPSLPSLNYMIMIGIPSAFDLIRGSNYEEHHSFYTEKRADQWAEIWFGSNYKGN
jgi:RHS repeat-associated protein